MSTLKVTTISDTAGTGPVTLTKQEGVKARFWYDQSGGNILRESFGISSVTDTSTGRITPNLTSAMSSTYYTIGYMNNAFNQSVSSSEPTTTSFRTSAYNSSHSVVDAIHYGSVVGDLA